MLPRVEEGVGGVVVVVLVVVGGVLVELPKIPPSHDPNSRLWDTATLPLGIILLDATTKPRIEYNGFKVSTFSKLLEIGKGE